MTIKDYFASRFYKWIMIYPRFKKVVVWIFSHLMKARQYHIGLAPGEIGSYVLLVEDPNSAAKISEFLDDSKEAANHREYCSYTGLFKGTSVTAISIGMGGPPAAIAIEELAAIGAKVFIFLGTCASIENDFLVVSGAVRDEGTGIQYTPLEIPAIADVKISACLQEICRERDHDYQVGIIHSRDAYYRVGYSKDDDPERISNKTYPGVCGFDMNTAAIFIVANVLSKKSGCLFGKPDSDGMISSVQIEMALEAVDLIDNKGKKA